jgi:hypothetical protein
MELVLRVNIGPLNVLKELINEVLASYPDRSYLRKEDRISQLTALHCNQGCPQEGSNCNLSDKYENKSRFSKLFWFEGFEN